MIDISGRLPGYRTGYARVHAYDGSAATVPIRGGLRIALNPAYAHTDAGRSTYVGPRLARPGFPALKAVAFTGDFEGYVSFAFGLSYHAPYKIYRLHDPQRIVIEFKHPLRAEALLGLLEAVGDQALHRVGGLDDLEGELLRSVEE